MISQTATAYHICILMFFRVSLTVPWRIKHHGHYKNGFNSQYLEISKKRSHQSPWNTLPHLTCELEGILLRLNYWYWTTEYHQSCPMELDGKSRASETCTSPWKSFFYWEYNLKTEKLSRKKWRPKTICK